MSSETRLIPGTYVDATIAPGQEAEGQGCQGVVVAYSGEDPHKVLVRGLATDYICAVHSMIPLGEDDIVGEFAEHRIRVRAEIAQLARSESRTSSGVTPIN